LLDVKELMRLQYSDFLRSMNISMNISSIRLLW